MSDSFVDTDVIVRFVTGDDSAKQAAAYDLFRRVREGAVTLQAPVTVIADAVHVLASPRLYNLPRAQIAGLLTLLARLPGFHVEMRRTVIRALEIYSARTSFDFGDAMLVASMEMADSRIIYSYDRHFDRVEGITRREPPSHGVNGAE
jgi:predicted nucleic acid-binding protein